jgi:ABC-2 type transport system ATP-binding protein
LEDLTLIELKSVSGSCGTAEIKSVSFRLPNGKIYGVFSPRYADSVALLSLMSGARTLTAGSVLVGGFDLHREANQARKEIGYLAADMLPDDALTPIEYLMAIADMRNLPFDKTIRYANELLELADLADKKDRLVANLSYGEQRVLCLLSLLLCKPEFLILTSPLAEMLPKDAQKMRELIAYFAQTCTVFLSTPLVEDLCKMCEEIIILQDGTLKSIAPATEDDLLAEYSVTSSDIPSEPEAKPKRKSTRWSMLTQKSDDYEVLDNNEKEDRK